MERRSWIDILVHFCTARSSRGWLEASQLHCQMLPSGERDRGSLAMDGRDSSSMASLPAKRTCKHHVPVKKRVW